MASSAGDRLMDVISLSGPKVLKSARTEEMQLCAECTTVAASCRCIKCECFMCFACFEEVHKVSKYMRKHQYEPLAATDLSKGCKEHLNRQIEYFCMDDERAICAHCVVMGSHKNHTVCSLEERKQQLLEAVAPLSSRANDALARLQKTLGMIDALILTSQSHEDAVVTDLQKHFEKLCFIFKSRKEKLEREFRRACTDKRKTLNEIHSDISLRKKCLEEAIANLSQLRVSCVTENSHLLESLQNMIADEYVVPSSLLSHIQLDLNAAEFIDYIMLHGKVIVSGDEAATSETITVRRLDSGDCQSTSVGNPLTKNLVETLSEGAGDCQPSSPAKVDRMTDMPRSPPCLRRMTDLPTSIVCSRSVTCNQEILNSDVDCVSMKSFGATVAGHSGSIFSPVAVKMENSSLSELKILPLSSSTVIPLQSSNSGQELPYSLPSSNFLNLIDKNRAASCSPFGVFQQKNAGVSQTSLPPVAQDLSFLSWRQGLHSSSYLSSSEATYQSSVCSGFSNRMEPVVISHIHHPGFFWVHFTKDLEQLTRLSQSIQDYCNGNHPVSDNLQKQFDVGEMVLAKFRDETWYRAQIIAKHDSETDKTVEVRFIDYGNIDTVAPDKVKAIRPFFLKVPQLASSCCLADVVPSGSDSWSAEAVESFALMASNLTMMMKVVKQDCMLKVRMSWPLIDGIRDDQMLYVSDALVFLEHATYTSPDSKLPNVDKKVASNYIHPVVLPKNVVIPVILTNVKSPHEFYVQICEKDATYFVEMMKDVQRTCITDLHNVLGLFLPFVGNSCLANFGDVHEPHWCRAEVMELLRKGHVRVRNVDFGGSKEVSVFQLKKLMDKFQVIPVQAVACCLADVEPVPGRPWDAAASQILESLSSNPLFMTIKGFSSSPLLYVYLSTDASFPSENLINFMLISKNLAVASRTSAKALSEVPEKCTNSPPKLTSEEKLVSAGVSLNSSTSPAKEQMTSVANLPKVIVSHFVSPNEFYIQVAAPKNIKHLENLMQELNAEYENSTPNADAEWKCSDECIARYSKDKRWYRAKITAITGHQVKVLCGDYGYSDIIYAGDLRLVEPRFMSTAWFSTRCHLVNVKPSSCADGWPESTCETLKKMICQKVCHISIKGPAVSISLPADIMLTKTVKGSALMPDLEVYVSITDWLFDQQLALPVNCPKTSPDLMSEDDDSDVETRSSKSAEDSVDPVAIHVLHSTNHCLEQKTTCRSITDFPMPEEPSANPFDLAVTFVDQDCCIYGQESKADLQLLSNLMLRVQSHYQYTMPESNCTVWKLGQPVAAQFLDDNLFYRAKIVSFRDDGIEVQYVDYGNTEVLRKERLRILDESFLAVPVQCLSCHLFKIRSACSDGRWPEATIRAVDELVNNKACGITVREKDASRSKLFVDLKLPTGQDLGSLLCEKGLALRGYDVAAKKISLCESRSPPLICNGDRWSQLPVQSKRLLPERTIASPYSHMALPALGDLLHVIITEIDHLNALYIQHIPMENPDEVLQQINFDLNQLLHLSSVYSSDAVLYQPLMENDLVPGTPCVARYSADDCWYRAEVICTSQIRGHMEVGVRFIDYGSSDFVSVDRLRAIPVEHLMLPAQCRKCRLYGVEMLSEDESYLADVTQKLTKLFADRVVVAVVRYVLSDDDILVDLFDRDLYLKNGSTCPCLYQCLIDDGLLDCTNGKSGDSVEIESGEEEEEGSVSTQLELAMN